MLGVLGTTRRFHRRFVKTYYDQKGDRNTVNLVVVTGGQTTQAIDFQLQSTLQTQITPAEGGALAGRTELGAQIGIVFPPGATAQSVQMVFSPTSQVFGPRGFTFDMDAYIDGVLQQDFTFNQPVTVRLDYTDEQLGGMNEKHLRLFAWNSTRQKWEDAACKPYDRHLEENWLTVAICHLSRYNWYDQPYLIMLPYVMH